jgi:hypothetical protein
MYRFASESSSRRREGGERFGLVWWREPGHVGRWGQGRRSKAGSRSEDGALRLGAGDFLSSLGAGGGGDKQRAVAVGDLRVALPEAKQGPDISLSLSLFFGSWTGIGREEGRQIQTPPRPTNHPSSAYLPGFSGHGSPATTRPHHPLFSFSHNTIIKSPGDVCAYLDSR